MNRAKSVFVILPGPIKVDSTIGCNVLDYCPATILHVTRDNNWVLLWLDDVKTIPGISFGALKNLKTIPWIV